MFGEIPWEALSYLGYGLAGFGLLVAFLLWTWRPNKKSLRSSVTPTEQRRRQQRIAPAVREAMKQPAADRAHRENLWR